MVYEVRKPLDGTTCASRSCLSSVLPDGQGKEVLYEDIVSYWHAVHCWAVQTLRLTWVPQRCARMGAPNG